MTQYIFGGHAVAICDMEKIVGKFNCMIEYKLLTLLNEANQVEGNYSKEWETMKNLIIEGRQTIERKGIDPIYVCDYNNFIFFTNNTNPVKISPNDRRYVIQTCSNKYIGNDEYFKKLSSQLNQDCANHFFEYLLSLDLGSFNLNKIPITPTRTEIIINSLQTVDKWLYCKSLDVSELLGKENKVSISDIYQTYKNDCKNEGYYLLTQTTFSRELNKIIGPTKIIKDKEQKSKRVFIFDYNKIKEYFKMLKLPLEIEEDINESDDSDNDNDNDSNILSFD